MDSDDIDCFQELIIAYHGNLVSVVMLYYNMIVIDHKN